jgi:hypothetical protein
MPRKKSTAVPAAPPPAPPIEEFAVGYGGTLRPVDADEPETKAELYGEDTQDWSTSTTALREAAEACSPLYRKLENIQYEHRYDLQQELAGLEGTPGADRAVLKTLKARLKAFPRTVDAWLDQLAHDTYAEKVVPEIQQWLTEPPNWEEEDCDYFERYCPEGQALAFFRDMDDDDLKRLGVEVIEGEFPGSSYFGANLRKDVDEANRIAQEAGIAVRFRADASR